MKEWGKVFFLFLAGAAAYGIIEILWRGRTHWAMAALGGVCFVICGGVNEYLSRETPLLLQCLLCAVLITAAELAAGMVLNVRMGLAIWDYSELPFQYRGQICLGYSCLWYLLSMAAILLDDWIRWRFFGEEKPQYHILSEISPAGC